MLQDFVDLAGMGVKGVTVVQRVEPLLCWRMWFTTESMGNDEFVIVGFGIIRIDSIGCDIIIIAFDIHVGEHIKWLEMEGSDMVARMV
jgi:hypothetical protein